MSVVTVDLGTTGCKVQVFDEEGREIAGYGEEIPTIHPRPDWAEQDPEAWWAALVRGVRGCAEAAEKPLGCRALCVCSHRESVLAVDASGYAIMPCILWADRRCEAEARDLEREFGEEIHQRTGMKADPYFTAPKILWVGRNRPRLLRRVHKFLLPKDYMIYRLTGRYSTDWTVASRTMMLDLRARRWWPEMIQHLGISEDQMCAPTDSHSVVGRVTGEVARELGIDERPDVVAGAGDRQCEALASGVSPERAMESTGSATNLSVSAPDLPQSLHRGLLYSCHAIRGQYLMEQGIGSTGLALRWFRDTFVPPSDYEAFRSDPYGFMDQAACRSPRGANGLIFLPFLSGAQATRWNPWARGAFFGLTLGHAYGDLVRSMLEGIAYEIRAAIRLLASQGQDPAAILALGGASRSSVWNQIKADVTGRTYARPRVPWAASLGALMLACRGVGIPLSDVEAINPVQEVWRPDPEGRSIYDASFARYERIYSASEGMYSP